MKKPPYELCIKNIYPKLFCYPCWYYLDSTMKKIPKKIWIPVLCLIMFGMLFFTIGRLNCSRRGLCQLHWFSGTDYPAMIIKRLSKYCWVVVFLQKYQYQLRFLQNHFICKGLFRLDVINEVLSDEDSGSLLENLTESTITIGFFVDSLLNDLIRGK